MRRLTYWASLAGLTLLMGLYGCTPAEETATTTEGGATAAPAEGTTPTETPEAAPAETPVVTPPEGAAGGTEATPAPAETPAPAGTPAPAETPAPPAGESTPPPGN